MGSFIIVQELTNTDEQFHNSVPEYSCYFSYHELHAGGDDTEQQQSSPFDIMLIIIKILRRNYAAYLSFFTPPH